MFRTAMFIIRKTIVQAALYGTFFMHLCNQSSRLGDVLDTCRRQEELNEYINLKSAFCWLTLHNCIAMHGTYNIMF